MRRGNGRHGLHFEGSILDTRSQISSVQASHAVTDEIDLSAWKPLFYALGGFLGSLLYARARLDIGDEDLYATRLELSRYATPVVDGPLWQASYRIQGREAKETMQ